MLSVLVAFVVGALAGAVSGVLVYRHNYAWVTKLEADAVAKAKDAVNKL